MKNQVRRERAWEECQDTRECASSESNSSQQQQEVNIPYLLETRRLSSDLRDSAKNFTPFNILRKKIWLEVVHTHDIPPFPVPKWNIVDLKNNLQYIVSIWRKNWKWRDYIYELNAKLVFILVNSMCSLIIELIFDNGTWFNYFFPLPDLLQRLLLNMVI